MQFGYKEELDTVSWGQHGSAPSRSIASVDQDAVSTGLSRALFVSLTR